MTAERSSLRILGMAAGLLVWSSGLIALYALHAVGCKLTWMELAVGPVSLLRIVLAVAWLLHLGLLAWLYVWFRRWRQGSAAAADRFIAVSSVALAIVALVATLYTGLPVVLLRQCV